jgi:putative SOS response-associated peptidase YedK
MADIHNRMPVILDAAAEKAWLNRSTDRQELQELLKPYPAEQMQAYAVSTQVNSPKMIMRA